MTGTGSVGLAFIYWTIGFLISLASGTIYLEYTACFPSRSGSEVAYLEQAYVRPAYFFPTIFAAQSVLFSFSSSNAIGESQPLCYVSHTEASSLTAFKTVLANYFFAISGHTATDWQIKGVAIAGYTLVIFSTYFFEISY